MTELQPQKSDIKKASIMDIKNGEMYFKIMMHKVNKARLYAEDKNIIIITTKLVLDRICTYLRIEYFLWKANTVETLDYDSPFYINGIEVAITTSQQHNKIEVYYRNEDLN